MKMILPNHYSMSNEPWEGYMKNCRTGLLRADQTAARICAELHKLLLEAFTRRTL